MHRAPHALGQGPHDRQAQADASQDQGLMALVEEPLEETLFDLGGNAVAVVGDGEHEATLFDAAVDANLGSAVLASVGQQVPEHLTEPQPIDPNDGPGSLDPNIDPGPHHRSGHLVDLVEDLDVLERVVEGPGVEAGGGEQVLDHARQIGRFGDDHVEQLPSGGRLRERRILLQQQSQAVDGGERGTQLVGGVGDEVFAGLAQFPLGGQSSLQLELALLATGQFAIHDDHRSGHQERHQKARQVADPRQELVRGGHLGVELAPLHHQEFLKVAEGLVEVGVGEIPGRLYLAGLQHPEDVMAGRREVVDADLEPIREIAIGIEAVDALGELGEGQASLFDRGGLGLRRVGAEGPIDVGHDHRQAQLGPHRGGLTQRLVGGMEGFGGRGDAAGPLGDGEHQGKGQHQRDADDGRKHHGPGSAPAAPVGNDGSGIRDVDGHTMSSATLRGH